MLLCNVYIFYRIGHNEHKQFNWIQHIWYPGLPWIAMADSVSNFVYIGRHREFCANPVNRIGLLSCTSHVLPCAPLYSFGCQQILFGSKSGHHCSTHVFSFPNCGHTFWAQHVFPCQFTHLLNIVLSFWKFIVIKLCF